MEGSQMRANYNIFMIDQLKIFKMMRKGHTNRSIASYFGVSDMFITYIRDDIKEKMKRFGFRWAEKKRIVESKKVENTKKISYEY